MMMHCIGCDRAVINMEQGGTVAIACTCGAGAPILYDPDGEGGLAPPASLVRLLMLTSESLAAPPHLEYYLGYSDYTSPLKEAAIKALRAHGSTSQSECLNPQCQEQFRHQVAEEGP